MKASCVAACVLAAAVLAATPAAAQAVTDTEVAKAVTQGVLGYVPLTIFDHVTAEVDGGVVTLTGRVTMPYKKNDLERRIARIVGVTAVHNRIGVLPASAVDDDLRYRIARAIYGNPSFWTYAAMANPPIHIIVERGRVTLAGVVNNNVERALARSLATGLGEISVTNELRTDADVRSH